MKILKDNYNRTEIIVETTVRPYPRKHICENCNSELEYDKEDLRMGVYGCYFIDCPLCGYDNRLDDHEDNIRLTKDNIKFPIHFHHTSVEDGAKNISNEEIEKYIKKAIEYLKNKDESDYYFTAFGDAMICIFKCDDDEVYEVTVSKGYYSTYIPYEKSEIS